MPPTSRWKSPLVALAALALLGAACGGGDDDAADPTPTAPDAAESTETTEAGEAEDEASGVTADDLLEAVDRTKAASSATVQIDAAFDGGPTFGTQELSLGGLVSFDGARGDITLEVGEGQGAIRVLLDDADAYVGGDFADVRDALPEGASWASVPREQLLASPGFTNPGDLAFLYLVGGASDVREDGDVLRFDIDVDRAVESAPEELREQVASTLTFTGERAPEVTGELELDDEGRITSLSVLGIQRPTAEETEQLSLDEDAELRITLDVALEGFDEPVDVEAPSSGVVPIGEAPELASMLGVAAAG